MTPRAQFRRIFFLALLLTVVHVAAAPQPRLTEPEVAAIAHAKAREEGYPVEAYTHGAPVYVQSSGVWEVHYFALQDDHDRTGKFSVAVDDASRFASLSLSYSQPPASATPPSARAGSGFSWLRAILIGSAVALIVRAIDWWRRRASDAHSDAKA